MSEAGHQEGQEKMSLILLGDAEHILENTGFFFLLLNKAL